LHQAKVPVEGRGRPRAAHDPQPRQGSRQDAVPHLRVPQLPGLAPDEPVVSTKDAERMRRLRSTPHGKAYGKAVNRARLALVKAHPGEYQRLFDSYYAEELRRADEQTA
jgi:hypothetical protein